MDAHGASLGGIGGRTWWMEEVEGFSCVEAHDCAGVNEVLGAVGLGENEAGDVCIPVEEEGFVGGCVGGWAG